MRTTEARDAQESDLPCASSPTRQNMNKRGWTTSPNPANRRAWEGFGAPREAFQRCCLSVQGIGQIVIAIHRMRFFWYTYANPLVEGYPLDMVRKVKI